MDTSCQAGVENSGSRKSRKNVMFTHRRTERLWTKVSFTNKGTTDIRDQNILREPSPQVINNSLLNST